MRSIRPAKASGKAWINCPAFIDVTPVSRMMRVVMISPQHPVASHSCSRATSRPAATIQEQTHFLGCLVLLLAPASPSSSWGGGGICGCRGAGALLLLPPLDDDDDPLASCALSSDIPQLGGFRRSRLSARG